MRMSKLQPEELIRIVASRGAHRAALKRFAAAGFSDIVAAAVHAAAIARANWAATSRRSIAVGAWAVFVVQTLGFISGLLQLICMS